MHISSVKLNNLEVYKFSGKKGLGLKNI